MTKLQTVPVSLKNRPRIPTPDVTKEVFDRDQRLALAANNTANIGAGVVGVIPANGHYPTDLSCPVVQVVLSPIAESEGTPKSGKGGTAALAQAVLSPTLTSAGLVGLTPVTVSQLTQLGFVTTTSPSLPRINIHPPTMQATLTEVNSSEEDFSGGSASGSTSSGSVTGQEERSIPLIGDRISPIGSQDSSPTFENYNERSPILMNPEKLSRYIVKPVSTQERERANAEARGRRSASLPGPPPMVQLREDRSMSLPHSPGLLYRDSQTVVATQGRLTSSDPIGQQVLPEGRLRTGSVGQEVTKSKPHEPLRRTSTPASTNSSMFAGAAVNNVPGSKRGEVYV